MLRRQKHSKNEVVAPKEEEDPQTETSRRICNNSNSISLHVSVDGKYQLRGLRVNEKKH
jgi:hypothetical protein